MTAPNATKAPATETRTRRAPARRDDRDTSRPRSGSAQRALERRQKRLDQQNAVLAAGGTVGETPAQRALRKHREGPVAAGLMSRLPTAPRALARRVPFVLAMLALVCAGLGLTLWLSTGSAENSYDLSRREDANKTLAEKKAALERDVKSGESAPGLAQRATELGMVPAGTLPVLIADPKGKVAVVGEPAPATGTPKPPLNAPAAGQNGSTTTDGSGTPTGGNSGQSSAGGEQLVTMNPGSQNAASSSTPSPSPAPQTPTPAAPTPAAPTAAAPAPQTPVAQTPAPRTPAPQAPARQAPAQERLR
ncbi:hypothetical protein [Tsukamurella sp. 1534]|uniref:hypothetical protein n=1 Tax=Tsukamurella sp. 1534 TaxID=1151061 RepID=UPI0002DF3E5B|nr:hypothetical protein [Tsukamurella sp. 1534]